MDSAFHIGQLTVNAETIHSLAAGFPREAARWRPAPEAWSPLEVVCHLYDEEREDFRAHLQGVLHIPMLPWSPIAPQEWVTQRHYNEREFEPVLENLLRERGESLAWLGGLKEPDWQAAYELPWGRLTASELLASWVAHDFLHIRQLNELRYAWLAQGVGAGAIRYAGDW